MNLLQSVALVLAVFTLPISSGLQIAEETSAQAAQEIVQPEQAEEWNLLLVNRWNRMPDGYKFVKKKLKNGLEVDERIYKDLTAMLADCGKAGLQPVVCSAYRSEATQTRLFKNKITRLRTAGYTTAEAEKEAMYWVAVPGTSEHHTGMAVDIVSAIYQTLDQKQEETAEQKWLMEHCWEYGFILRYPSDKSEITGIGYEPWHYRYVGKETALAMRDSGLCLEEYLRMVRTQEAPQDGEISPEMNQEATEIAS